MKRRPKRYLEELRLTFDETAALFGIEGRTLRRWESCGLLRAADGRFSFPLTALWVAVLKHRHDRRCNRHPERDLMALLGRAMILWPDRTKTIGDAQRLIYRLTAFGLSQETLDAIRADED